MGLRSPRSPIRLLRRQLARQQVRRGGEEPVQPDPPKNRSRTASSVTVVASSFGTPPVPARMAATRSVYESVAVHTPRIWSRAAGSASWAVMPPIRMSSLPSPNSAVASRRRRSGCRGRVPPTSRSLPGAAEQDVVPAAAGQQVVAGAAVGDHRRRDARVDHEHVVAGEPVEVDRARPPPRRTGRSAGRRRSR